MHDNLPVPTSVGALVPYVADDLDEAASRFGASSFGRDPLLSIRRAEDLECIFGRIKPAHTLLFFAYGAPAATVRQQRFSFGASSFGGDPLLRLIVS